MNLEIPAPSSETVETLLNSSPELLYEKIALWLMDANVRQIAEFFDQYQHVEPKNHDVMGLVLTRWTELDPKGALASTSDNWHDSILRSWAANDPDAAFAAIDRTSSSETSSFLFGIYPNHSDWLMRHLNEFPAEQRQSILLNMGLLSHSDQPEELFEFIESNGGGFPAVAFRDWVMKDPWTAFSRILADGKRKGARGGGVGEEDNFSIFVDTLASKDPELLQKFAEQAPSGEFKLKLEQARFDNLLKTDPAAAEREAMETTAPRIARQQLGAVGMSLLENEPERALAIVSRLLEVDPWALQQGKPLSAAWGKETDSSYRLMETLLYENPGETMAAFAQSGTLKLLNPNLPSVPQTWANSEPAAMGDWIDHQSDPAVIEPLSNVLSRSLLTAGDFEGAATRANYGQRSVLPIVLFEWSGQDMEAAMQWLDSSGMSASQIEWMKQNYIKKP
ncbi:hypothetical protein JIN85_18630 [Luteolibacter pohnpeiensis]|uniref:Uncharacterized protein n=1 Tax=Luteolibacter pohnpeiensis TaxID=454153 RepID=A0A934SEJ6_9BACT|nr:hypothetical protein [Luteolibacter pohnpeiensis]MBK1884439.1 hypothetical protein [Luteolibacter pohnpeiensis]